MAASRRATVLGSAIAHSLSPVLHRAAYAELGLDWSYDAIECTAEQLAATLDRLAADPSYAGLSLTMPLKTAVLELLDEVDELAMAVRAVNTVLLAAGPGGRRRGLNTDVAGIGAGLDELGTHRPARPVVLGAGGTARAALAALASRGSAHVLVLVRDQSRAGELLGAATALGVSVELAAFSDAATAVPESDLVVSTAPAGATDELAAARWPSGVPLLDVVYAPWPTALGAAAMAAGAPVVGGLSVLVGQAVGQVAAMTGLPGPAAAMRAAGLRALRASG